MRVRCEPGFDPLGDLIDVIDPFGVHKIPSAIMSAPAALGRKVDDTEHKAAVALSQAGSGAAARIDHAVTNAASSAKDVAITFAVCGVLATAIAGGVYAYAVHARHARSE